MKDHESITPERKYFLAHQLVFLFFLFLGVLSYYKENKSLKEAERNAKIKERNDILTRIAVGAKRNEPITEPSDLEINDEDDDDDDIFLEQYRHKRLQG
jgi:hypothetical protein